MDDPEITRAWSFLRETVRSYRPAWEEALVEHARLVHDLSMEIARLLTAQGRSVDRRILALGAILHDVGRSRGRRLVEHGIKSGEILREQGFPEAAARLAETHVGVGIHPEQAASLGLPPGDYIPRTLEERIACYADNLLAYLPEEGRHEIGDAEAAAERLTFPGILKPPMKTPKWEQNTKAKVFKVFSAPELLDLYDRCSSWAELLMVQEWVEGSDAELYSCNCYFNAASEPVVTFIARKLRQWPPETGTSCLGEECRNDEVLRESIRLFKSVRYRGLGYVEMKRDQRTGKHFIIEPNIGRPTGRSAIAEAGGVELLYSKYCDVAGLPLPTPLEQKYQGVKWIYLRRDLQSAYTYWKRGELTIWQWLRSLKGRKTYAVFSWTDPAPFWADLRRSISRLPRRAKAAEQSRETVMSRHLPHAAGLERMNP